MFRRDGGGRLIRQHEFNTNWFGRPVGIIDRMEFFSLPITERQARLQDFAWVEFSARDLSPEHRHSLMETGFFFADTQIHFRLALSRVPKANERGFLVEFSDQNPFCIAPEEIPDFQHERFRCVSGITMEALNRRYRLWVNDLIQDSPDRCLRIVHEGRVQGWFLSRRVHGKGLNLTLAFQHRRSSVSGLLLYQVAIEAYVSRGEAQGWAAFSVTNTPVHNMYAFLGARFAAPTEHYLWIAREK
jgi:hypothetical protein